MKHQYNMTGIFLHHKKCRIKKDKEWKQFIWDL